MKFELLHPADQILGMIERIYRHGMTTTSGGNLSVLDEEGAIWITPAGVDKGALTRGDMVCVKPDGRTLGVHRPSSEFPFHQLIYRARPDLKAVIHAHPPALVAFSAVRRMPDTRLLPGERQICGEVGMAEYALPGSVELGERIAAVFARGIRSVMLENHGVVVGGVNLFEAFKAFETLDFCARLEINARQLGQPRLLDQNSLALAGAAQAPALAAYPPDVASSEEREARRSLCALVRRAYEQQLFTSTQGTFSQRLADGSFIITPYDLDRHYLEPEHLVRIDRGAREEGKTPSRSARLHQLIYERQPHVQSVLIAHPPHIMAFAVTENEFDSRIIPESYILLRDMPKLPFSAVYTEEERTAAVFEEATPIALVENNAVIVTGSSLLQAFDRLEVAEYSAKAIIAARTLGEALPMEARKIAEIEQAFHLAKKRR